METPMQDTAYEDAWREDEDNPEGRPDDDGPLEDSVEAAKRKAKEADEEFRLAFESDPDLTEGSETD